MSERRELIRVDMTQAQFAEMITSPNRGSGVPCTISHFTGDKGQPWVHERHGGRPSPPDPEHYTKKYKNAASKRAEIVSSKIKAANDKAIRLFNGDDKPTKSNLKELIDALNSATLNLDQNLAYVMEEMEEGIENRMATAISEFESYVSFSLKAKGLEHLSEQAPRLSVGAASTHPKNR